MLWGKKCIRIETILSPACDKVRPAYEIWSSEQVERGPRKHLLEKEANLSFACDRCQAGI